MLMNKKLKIIVAVLGVIILVVGIAALINFLGRDQTIDDPYNLLPQPVNEEETRRQFEELRSSQPPEDADNEERLEHYQSLVWAATEVEECQIAAEASDKMRPLLKDPTSDWHESVYECYLVTDSASAAKYRERVEKYFDGEQRRQVVEDFNNVDSRMDG